MEQTINAIIKQQCFNCKDKGTVVISNEHTRYKAVLIPCPICQPEKKGGKQEEAS